MALSSTAIGIPFYLFKINCKTRNTSITLHSNQVPFFLLAMTSKKPAQRHIPKGKLALDVEQTLEQLFNNNDLQTYKKVSGSFQLQN